MSHILSIYHELTSIPANFWNQSAKIKFRIVCLVSRFFTANFFCSGDWQNKQVLGVKWNWGPRMGKHEREKRELTLITFNYSRGNKEAGELQLGIEWRADYPNLHSPSPRVTTERKTYPRRSIRAISWSKLLLKILRVPSSLIYGFFSMLGSMLQARIARIK